MTTLPNAIDARELSLFTTNSADIYRQRSTPIMIMLAKRIAAGTYCETRAMIAWQYAADDGARAYTREFVDRNATGFGTFTKPTRALAAVEIANHYDDELQDIADDLRHGRRNRVTGDRKPEPPNSFGVGVFDWSHDTCGNPTALFDIPALSYRAPRRVQVGYGDKISAGVLGYLRDRFPGWDFTIEKTFGDRSAGRASLDTVALKTGGNRLGPVGKVDLS